MENMLTRLDEEILVSDGAMGTMLIGNGMPQGACPELWACENREKLYSIHRSYLDAGADMITTNTFGANAIKLKKFNLSGKAIDINKKAVEIAKDAAKGSAYVLGDIGPTGDYLKPAGSLDEEGMFNVFTQQVKALEQAGVDGFIIETMSDLAELKQAIMAVREHSKLLLISCMAFQRTESKGFRTTSGATIPQLVDEALLAGSDVIGMNCGLTIEEMTEAVKEMRGMGSAFIIAQPNAGMPELVKGKTVYKETPEDFAGSVPGLIKSGANIIGGCCGTTPEHVRAIRKAVSSV